MKKMKIERMNILFSLLLCSCMYNPVYTGSGKESYLSSQLMLEDLPRHTLDMFVQGLADELLRTNVVLTEETPLAMVSFVDLEQFNETNWLGNALSEGMIFQLQRRGFTIVDYKNTGAIRVTEKGDFTLTRDWLLIEPEQNVNYLLVGTMLRQDSGIIINTRIVNVNTRIVVASGQGFLPLSYIGRGINNQKQVRIENGSITRDAKRHVDTSDSDSLF